MPLVTFGQLCNHCAEKVRGGGSCANSDETKKIVNDAIRMLAKQNPSAIGSQKSILLPVNRKPNGECYITLPREIETIVAAKHWNGAPIDTRSQNFAFADNGPWTNDANLTGQIHDLGTGWPTMLDFDSTRPSRLMIITDSTDEYENAVILLKGKDTHGRDILTGANNEIHGERLSDFGPSPKFTISTFKYLDGVLLTKAKGYRYLYQYFTGTQEKILLSRYHPDEGQAIGPSCPHAHADQPGYRRYSIPTNCGDNLHCLVTLSILTLNRPEEIPVIQDLDAVFNMVSALAARGSENYQDYSILKNMANNELEQQEARHRGSEMPFLNVNVNGRFRQVGKVPNRFTYRRFPR